jgi:chromate transporter
VLPGPEATELACYFGLLAGGRLGALVGGLGFILPGFCLMLLFSWFYTAYGTSNAAVSDVGSCSAGQFFGQFVLPVQFLAVFAGLQPAVCAMVFRAAHKIGDTICRGHGTGPIDKNLFLVCCLVRQWLAR